MDRQCEGAEIAVAGWPESVPSSIVPLVNTSIPNVARIYDYLLGGKDNFAADRDAAEDLLALIPDARTACHHNRVFLQRAVRYLAGQAGIRQFIDIGTGLPTQGNVHEIAQQTAPDARVVYVDYDPMVVSHAQALLATAPTVTVINGDLRHPEKILADPGLHSLIDFRQPVAILLGAILHFIADDEHPYQITDTLKAAMPPGSYLVLSHITSDEVPEETSRKAQSVYGRATAPVFPRSHGAIRGFLAGLETGLEAGITDVTLPQPWAPRTPGEPQPARPRIFEGRTLIYAGIGRKAHPKLPGSDLPGACGAGARTGVNTAVGWQAAGTSLAVTIPRCAQNPILNAR
jgi:hypothetical protein